MSSAVIACNNGVIRTRLDSGSAPSAKRAGSDSALGLPIRSSSAARVGIRHSINSEFREVTPLVQWSRAGAVPKDQQLQLRAPRKVYRGRSLAGASETSPGNGGTMPWRPSPAPRSHSMGTIVGAREGEGCRGSASTHMRASTPPPLPLQSTLAKALPRASHRAPPARPQTAPAWDGRIVRVGSGAQAPAPAPDRADDGRSESRGAEPQLYTLPKHVHRGTLYASQISMHLAHSALGRIIVQRERYVEWATSLLNGQLPELIATVAITRTRADDEGAASLAARREVRLVSGRIHARPQ